VKEGGDGAMYIYYSATEIQAMRRGRKGKRRAKE
jgi:hypothetical protein